MAEEGRCETRQWAGGAVSRPVSVPSALGTKTRSLADGLYCTVVLATVQLESLRSLASCLQAADAALSIDLGSHLGTVIGGDNRSPAGARSGFLLRSPRALLPPICRWPAPPPHAAWLHPAPRGGGRTSAASPSLARAVQEDGRWWCRAERSLMCRQQNHQSSAKGSTFD